MNKKLLRLSGNEKDQFVFTDKDDMSHKFTVDEDLVTTVISTAGALLKCTVDGKTIIDVQICEDTDDEQ